MATTCGAYGAENPQYASSCEQCGARLALICPSCGAQARPTARFCREGGKKRVYLAHDSRLDRDVAFALIKAEGLDDAGLSRFTREALERALRHKGLLTA